LLTFGKTVFFCPESKLDFIISFTNLPFTHLTLSRISNHLFQQHFEKG